VPRPSHHRPSGRFRAPWPEAAGDDAIRRRIHEVAREWVRTPLPPDPDPDAFPTVEPDIATPTVGDGEARITWVGHATFLLQLPGLNLLTDPVWSRRVSPVSFLGSARFVPAVPRIRDLPPIHAVLLSHDHYDHLDRSTVRALDKRFGAELTWFTPLGYRPWFSTLGIRNVVELDWWDSADAPGGRFRVTAAPARHWCRRTPWDTNTRLWSSWAVLPAGPDEGSATPRIYFAGDSAYASCFEEIGRRLGPFDASLIPVGAYEPRWFMKASHVDPEEAVRIYQDLGSTGLFIPTHWGTFRLTFEDPLEPPTRTRAAWDQAGLPPEDLEVLRHGETLTLTSE
jgi:N-acyl-phosphatidylethanolamine-hydrolysing phospholipase D